MVCGFYLVSSFGCGWFVVSACKGKEASLVGTVRIARLDIREWRVLEQIQRLSRAWFCHGRSQLGCEPFNLFESYFYCEIGCEDDDHAEHEEV